MDRSPDVVGGRPPARRERPPEESDEIRAGIAETRADLGETVRALRDRLAPRRLVRAGGRRIDRSGRARGLAAVARAYPVAALVVGVTLGWIALRAVRMARR